MAKVGVVRAGLKCAVPIQGSVACMDSVDLLKGAPRRDNEVAFIDFLLMPEDIAANSNDARHGSGLSGVAESLDPEIARMQDSNCPASAGPSVVIEVSDQPIQADYNQNGTNVRK